MKKLLVPILLILGIASSGCVIVDEPVRHHHCFGCGHVYIKGTWR